MYNDKYKHTRDRLFGLKFDQRSEWKKQGVQQDFGKFTCSGSCTK